MVMARRAPRIRHIHSSGRFDRSVRSLLKALWWYITWADLVTLTEMSDDRRGKALDRIPGFTRVQVGGSGRDECAALVRKRKFKVTAVRPILLSAVGLPTRNGQRVWALEFVMTHRRTGKTVTVWVIHWPNNAVINPTLSQATAPTSIHANGRRIISTKMFSANTDFVLATGDWNWSWRNPHVRRLIKHQFGDMNVTWDGDVPKHYGTLGIELIDWSITDMEVRRSRVMRDDPSSDHTPFREVLIMKEAA